ncbi:MAG: FkbM family methyltransferase [Mucilaginibacter sp.]|nr:FkbM family methyltransferase [Mucilaginibacter sp.]
MIKIKRTIGFILGHPLGKRHLLKAIFKFCVWQLQTTFSKGGMFVKDFVAPVKFYATKGLTGITGNIYVGLHEFNDMAFLLHFLNENDTFYDIGANVGSYTLLASGVRSSKCISIEPVQSTYDLLCKNIKLNNLQHKCQAINAGAGARKGILKFSTSEDTTNHVISEGENTFGLSIDVNVITIDSIVTEGAPALIKIDVEGFETEVMKGMAATLENETLKAIIIELNGSGTRYGFNEEQIHKLLLSNGFLAYVYDPFKRSLNKMDSYGAYNTIYVRDLAAVNQRIQNAPVIKVFGELI